MHFSKFMPIFFHEETDETRKYSESAIFVSLIQKWPSTVSRRSSVCIWLTLLTGSRTTALTNVCLFVLIIFVLIWYTRIRNLCSVRSIESADSSPASLKDQFYIAAFSSLQLQVKPKMKSVPPVTAECTECIYPLERLNLSVHNFKLQIFWSLFLLN